MEIVDDEFSVVGLALWPFGDDVIVALEALQKVRRLHVLVTSPPAKEGGCVMTLVKESDPARALDVVLQCVARAIATTGVVSEVVATSSCDLATARRSVDERFDDEGEPVGIGELILLYMAGCQPEFVAA